MCFFNLCFIISYLLKIPNPFLKFYHLTVPNIRLAIIIPGAHLRISIFNYFYNYFFNEKLFTVRRL